MIILLCIVQSLTILVIWVMWREYAITRNARLNTEAKNKHKADRHRLKLCEKHNPISGLSNYAEHNCDYCKLLKEKLSNV